ncbi:MAG: ABC transporter permease [Burkholderiales bacterium RIFCSPLOWO2_02_FULL_57_36]|nr:MAG: ABC transporter permease [Burkholderiales bacterium RIFCSPLOWO2_02_FULL_57_36]
MTRLIALWCKEFIALSRDRHGLLALFLMPAIFVLVMSLALRDSFTPGTGNNLHYAVLDADGSNESSALANRLERAGVIKRDKTAATGRTKLRDAVREGRLAFVLVIPKNFGTTLMDERNASSSPMLQIWADPAASPLLHAAFRQQVQGALGSLQAQTLIERSGPLTAGFGAAAPDAGDWQRQVALETVQRGETNAIPSSVQQSVPAWLIFSMFFVVIPMSALFITERRDGSLQRLRTQRVPFHLILSGKLLPFFAVNQVQAVLMVLVGIYIVPLMGGEALTLPDAPLALWSMSAAVSLAAVCWALLIASIARTSEQATIVGGVGNILMGAIGGVMVPKFIMPAFMQTLAAVSPMAWALDGFHMIMLRGGGIADIWPYAGALLSLAVACLTIAIWINRRSVRS